MSKIKNIFNVKIAYKKLNEGTGLLKANNDGTYTLYINLDSSIEVQSKAFFHEITHLFIRLLTDKGMKGKSTKPLDFIFDNLEDEEKICEVMANTIWNEFLNMKRVKK